MTCPDCNRLRDTGLPCPTHRWMSNHDSEWDREVESLRAALAEERKAREAREDLAVGLAMSLRVAREDESAARAELARVREALTPSGETKAAYIGEFEFDGYDGLPVGVPWTTIKEIMAAILKRAALTGPPPTAKPLPPGVVKSGGWDGQPEALRAHLEPATCDEDYCANNGTASYVCRVCAAPPTAEPAQEFARGEVAAPVAERVTPSAPHRGSSSPAPAPGGGTPQDECHHTQEQRRHVWETDMDGDKYCEGCGESFEGSDFGCSYLPVGRATPPAGTDTHRERCGLCGRPAAGYAVAGDVRLCHPDDPGEPDCYTLWTRDKKRPPAGTGSPEGKELMEAVRGVLGLANELREAGVYKRNVEAAFRRLSDAAGLTVTRPNWGQGWEWVRAGTGRTYTADLADLLRKHAKCRRCGGDGRVQQSCPDPQCGDSTWDHECEAGTMGPCPDCGGTRYPPDVSAALGLPGATSDGGAK